MYQTNKQRLILIASMFASMLFFASAYAQQESLTCEYDANSKTATFKYQGPTGPNNQVILNVIKADGSQDNLIMPTDLTYPLGNINGNDTLQVGVTIVGITTGEPDLEEIIVSDYCQGDGGVPGQNPVVQNFMGVAASGTEINWTLQFEQPYPTGLTSPNIEVSDSVTQTMQRGAEGSTYTVTTRHDVQQPGDYTGQVTYYDLANQAQQSNALPVHLEGSTGQPGGGDLTCEYDANSATLTLIYKGATGPNNQVILNVIRASGVQENLNMPPDMTHPLPDIDSDETLQVGITVVGVTAGEPDFEEITVSQRCQDDGEVPSEFPVIQSFTGDGDQSAMTIQWTLQFEDQYPSANNPPRLTVNGQDYGEMESSMRLFGFGGREYHQTTRHDEAGIYTGGAIYYDANGTSETTAPIAVTLEEEVGEIPTATAENITLYEPGIRFTIINGVTQQELITLELISTADPAFEKTVSMSSEGGNLVYFLKQSSENLQEGQRISYTVRLNDERGVTEHIYFQKTDETPIDLYLRSASGKQLEPGSATIQIEVEFNQAYTAPPPPSISSITKKDGTAIAFEPEDGILRSTSDTTYTAELTLDDATLTEPVEILTADLQYDQNKRVSRYSIENIQYWDDNVLVHESYVQFPWIAHLTDQGNLVFAVPFAKAPPSGLGNTEAADWVLDEGLINFLNFVRTDFLENDIIKMEYIVSNTGSKGAVPISPSPDSGWALRYIEGDGANLPWGERGEEGRDDRNPGNCNPESNCYSYKAGPDFYEIAVTSAADRQLLNPDNPFIGPVNQYTDIQACADNELEDGTALVKCAVQFFVVTGTFDDSPEAPGPNQGYNRMQFFLGGHRGQTYPEDRNIVKQVATADQLSVYLPKIADLQDFSFIYMQNHHTMDLPMYLRGVQGKILSHNDYRARQQLEQNLPKPDFLPPQAKNNANSCQECHGRNGSGKLDSAVIRFTDKTADKSRRGDTTYRPYGITAKGSHYDNAVLDYFGEVFYTKAVNGLQPDGQFEVAFEAYNKEELQANTNPNIDLQPRTAQDNKSYTPTKAIFTFRDVTGPGTEALQQAVDNDDIGIFLLNTPRLVGMLAIEAIDEQSIEDYEAQSKRDLSDASGEINRIPMVSEFGELIENKAGRFGMMAELANLNDMVAKALFGEMNITTSKRFEGDLRFPDLNCGINDTTCSNAGNTPLEKDRVEQIADYMRWLAVPTRDGLRLEDPNSEVNQGEQIFADTGCAVCHKIAPVTVTTGGNAPSYIKNRLINNTFSYIGSDFLIHDMGYLSRLNNDEIIKFRTPPLWGLQYVTKVNGTYETPDECAYLLHDGRACDPIEAAFLHDGPAIKHLGMIDKLEALSQQQLEQLAAFLNSL